MADSLSERDDLTLRELAIIEDVPLAEIRLRALADYARRARRADRNLAEAVRLMLASRRNRRPSRANVIPLGSRHG